MAAVTEQQILEKMRRVCTDLTGTEEVVTYGHPGFKANGRLFAVLEHYKGELSLCVKVGTDVQDIFLRDPRYYMTPYVGHQGWVSLKVRAAPLKWDEIRELLSGSYQMVMAAPKLSASKRSKPRPRSRSRG